MAWPSVDAFWQAMTCAGPWHRCPLLDAGAAPSTICSTCVWACLCSCARTHTALLPPCIHAFSLYILPLHSCLCSRLLAHGEEHMEGVRREFMRGYADPQAPLRHTARARLLCLRRLPAPAASL